MAKNAIAPGLRGAQSARQNARHQDREKDGMYRPLLDFAGLGFCTVQLSYGADGKLADGRFLDTNGAFEIQTGLTDAAGRSIKELMPEHHGRWLAVLSYVAETGDTAVVSGEAGARGRWYDAYVFLAKRQDRSKAAIAFRDITPYVRAGQNEAFLCTLQGDLNALSSPEEILNAAGEKLKMHFHAARVMFLEANDACGTITCIYDNRDPGALTALSTLRTDDRVQKWMEGLRGGRVWAAEDVQADPLFEDVREALITRRIHALMAGPYVRDGRLKFLIVVCACAPCSWREDEKALLAEICARVYPCLTRARSEEKLVFQAGLLDSVNEAVIARDENFITTYWNSMAEKLSGYTAGEVVGKPAKQQFERMVTNATLYEIAEAIREKGFYSGELTVRRKDGKLCDTEAHTRMLTGAKGEFKGIVTSVRDITGRRAAENTLRLQAHLLNNVNEAIAAVDKNWNIIYWNDRAEEMYGWKKEHAAGLCVKDISLIEVSGLSWDMAMKRFLECDAYVGEILVPHKDGQPVATDLHAKALRDDKGMFKGAVFTFRDITERREAEKKLIRSKQREEFLQLLTSRLLLCEASKEVLNELCVSTMRYLNCDVFFNYLADPGIRRLHLNCYAGISEEEAKDLKHLDYGAAACGCVAMEGRRMVACNIQKKNDPRTDPLKSYGLKAYACHPLAVEGGVIGTLAFGSRCQSMFSEEQVSLMDIVCSHIAIALSRLQAKERLQESERKALSLVEELKEADRNKNEYLSVLSHELRNPLATIKAGLSLLVFPKDPARSARAKESIKRQVSHLASLVEDLLDLTRISHNKIVLKKEVLELSALVREVFEDYRCLFADAGIRLAADTGNELLFLEADPVRLKEIIGNLLQNAVKFSSKGGTTQIRGRRAGKHAVVSVEDDGIGIHPELLQRIFQPFVQADTSLQRNSGGLGLGLSVVKKIAELHGGSAEAQSGGPGQGSRFSIRLPLCRGRAKEGVKEAAAHGGENSSKRILLVEDNIELAEILCDGLCQYGHVAVTALDGTAGIHMARLFKPDVVFCDIGLPGLNGFEVAKRIKKEPALQNAALIALTGYAGPKDFEYAREAGFDLHLTKPVDLSTMEQAIKSVLKKKRE